MEENKKVIVAKGIKRKTDYDKITWKDYYKIENIIIPKSVNTAEAMIVVSFILLLLMFGLELKFKDGFCDWILLVLLVFSMCIILCLHWFFGAKLCEIKLKEVFFDEISETEKGLKVERRIEKNYLYDDNMIIIGMGNKIFVYSKCSRGKIIKKEILILLYSAIVDELESFEQLIQGKVQYIKIE